MVNRTYSPIWQNEKPLEILEDVTGEGLNANYLADYLEAKYKEIYEL